MKKFDTRSISGCCNYFEEHTIEVTGQKAHPVGQPAPSFVPTTYECDNQDKCQMGNKCPIFRNAHMKW